MLVIDQSEYIEDRPVPGPFPDFPMTNLVPRACDPWEGNEGSGIIRCRKPGIVAKIELRIHFNSQSESSLKRIIPEPSFPSRGSQARGTRLPNDKKGKALGTRLQTA